MQVQINIKPSQMLTQIFMIEEVLTKDGDDWTVERTSPDGKTMSEVVTEWLRENSVIPTQPIYTSVMDLPPDNKETQRKRRIVCSLVGVYYNEDDYVEGQANPEEETQSELIEDVVEQLIHKGHNVQIAGVRSKG